MSQQVFSRNWSSYNLAQTSEKLVALRILNDAVNYLNIPYEYKGNGRPQIGLDDMLKCCVIKVFNNFSSRRTIPDLQVAYALQYIRQIPHFNSINNYMQKEELTSWLHKLYKSLAMPLAGIEDVFAVDATGFSTFMKRHWIDWKSDEKSYKIFSKLHITSGVRTKIIVSAKVTEGARNDSPYFQGMLRDASQSFRIRQVCADAGYLSRKNCAAVEEVGARPFIALKSNTSFSSERYTGTAWQRMLEFWEENNEIFMDYYHQRSNVESAFSMMKRKFLPYIRSKSEQAQFNEMLCKVVCHNLGVLCAAMFEMNLRLNF